MEIMKLSRNISSTCLKVVYDSFIRKGETEKFRIEEDEKVEIFEF